MSDEKRTLRLTMTLRDESRAGDKYGRVIAEIDVDVFAARGWVIFLGAAADAIKPTVEITFDQAKIPPEELEKIKERWKKRHA